MGLGGALSEVGAKIGEGSAFYRTDETLVSRVLTTDSSGWNGLYGMHPADLLRVLAASLAGDVTQFAGQRVDDVKIRQELRFAVGQPSA